MENQRSLKEKSKSSSLIRHGESLSSTNAVLLERQKDVSAKNFGQSCPFRIEDIDRHAIIKRQDMESSLKRLSDRDDVYGVIVATIDGRILYECDALKNWISGLAPLCSFARHLIRNNDPNDDMQALRLRTKSYEIILTIHQEQLLIVMQMFSSGKTNDVAVENDLIEEDWEAFLKRIEQHKLQNE